MKDLLTGFDWALKRIEKPKPIREFYKMMGRFSHLQDEDLEGVQQAIDRRLALIEKLASGEAV